VSTFSIALKQSGTWRSVFALCVLSGAFTAGYKALDNIVVHNYILSEDKATAASAYLIVGGWVGVLCGVVFSFFLGRRLIDPDFSGFIFRNKRMHIFAALTGGISALSTLANLRGNQEADPSVLVVFGGMVFVLTAIYDVVQKQLKFREFLIPAVISVIGCGLVAFGGSFSGIMVVVVSMILISNPLNAFNEVLEQRGARTSDGANFFIWRFVWLASVGTVTVILIAVVRGQTGLLGEVTHKAVTTVETMAFVVATMLFVYLAISLRMVAKKTLGVAVSYVFLLGFSVQAILAVPITLAGEVVWPGLFGSVPTDTLVWLVRVAGVLMVCWGIYRLQKMHTRLA